jgi:hypothetical protein
MHLTFTSIFNRLMERPNFFAGDRSPSELARNIGRGLDPQGMRQGQHLHSKPQSQLQHVRCIVSSSTQIICLSDKTGNLIHGI